MSSTSTSPEESHGPDPESPQGPAGLEPTTTPALHPDRSQARLLLTLIGLGAAIGIPAALVASGFLALVHELEHWLWDELPESMGLSSPPWYFVVFLPVVGAVIVAVARAVLPGDGGHTPLHGLGGAPTPVRYALGIALAALGTLSFGAVLGPEAPLIALGSAVGMAVTPWIKAGKQGEQVLATAGSFSAISALFGGPLVAGIFLLESGLAAGTALIPALLPGLAAAAVGYVMFTGLGDWGGLSETALKVPGLPAYNGTRLLDLVLAIVVGVVVSLIMAQVKGLGHRVDRAATGSATRKYGILLLGGLAVGLIAQGARLLGADSQAILFSGQTAVPEVLAQTSVGVLLVMLVAKALGYAVSLGAGFRGGPVFPAIFLGVAVATFACIWFDSSITWALVVGTAAGMTAGTGLVFCAMLFGMLLAGSAGQDALPAAVLAVIAAWLTNAAQTRRAAAAAGSDPSS